jgi:hypothetical protein
MQQGAFKPDSSLRRGEDDSVGFHFFADCILCQGFLVRRFFCRSRRRDVIMSCLEYEASVVSLICRGGRGASRCLTRSSVEYCHPSSFQSVTKSAAEQPGCKLATALLPFRDKSARTIRHHHGAADDKRVNQIPSHIALQLSITQRWAKNSTAARELCRQAPPFPLFALAVRSTDERRFDSTPFMTSSSL